MNVLLMRMYVEKFARLAMVALPLAFALLNLAWFCYHDFRFYWDSALINRLIVREISEHRSGLPSSIQTARDFMDAYPNCCEVEASDQGFNLISWIFGNALRDVFISYPVLIDGKRREYMVIYSVDCCGGVWAKRTDF